MKELLGKSLYQFHHVLDAEAIEKSYKTRKLYTPPYCSTLFSDELCLSLDYAIKAHSIVCAFFQILK